MLNCRKTGLLGEREIVLEVFLFTCLAGSASDRLAPDPGRRFPAEVVISTFPFDQPRRIAWTSIHPPSGSYYGAPALVRDFRGG